MSVPRSFESRGKFRLYADSHYRSLCRPLSPTPTLTHQCCPACAPAPSPPARRPAPWRGLPGRRSPSKPPSSPLPAAPPPAPRRVKVRREGNARKAGACRRRPIPWLGANAFYALSAPAGSAPGKRARPWAPAFPSRLSFLLGAYSLVSRFLPSPLVTTAAAPPSAPPADSGAWVPVLKPEDLPKGVLRCVRERARG